MKIIRSTTTLYDVVRASPIYHYHQAATNISQQQNGKEGMTLMSGS